MQSNNANTDKDRPMHFTQDELLAMSEGQLLNFVLAYHQFKHSEFKAINDVANELDVEPQTISNYLAGKGQPGLDQLITLYRHTHCALVAEWINARKDMVVL